MKSCRGYKGNSCVVGEQPQPYENFYKNSRMKDGYVNTCKSCDLARSKKRYLDNRAEVLERTKAYGKANRHITRKASKTYYSKNRDAAIQRRLDWSKANPERAAAMAAEYRARKANATPIWLTKEQKAEIVLFYDLARDCQITTGEKYHVDHIVPLKGENVCGLHVPWNLQVLPADVNIAKSNNHGTETFGSTGQVHSGRGGR